MRRIAVVLGVASLAAGCSGTAQRPLPVAVPPAPPKPAPAPCDPTRVVSLAGEVKTYVAVVRSHAEVRVVRRLRLRNMNGVPKVLAVEAMRQASSCRPAWYRVQLPVRPNGTSGWVQAAAVRILWVDTRIVIRVKAMRLELLRGGHVVLRTPIAPGAPETPTPVGRFYVTERVVPKNPNGPWGPAALGTSAFSPVLKDWVQGGPIGIHGTNEPWVIGHAASHGCIRLPNDAMRKLFRLTPAGTPVVIVR